MSTTHSIKVPRVSGSTEPSLHMDLSRAYTALGRVEEVASVTPQKAPELMSTFNRAYLDLGKWFSLIGLEKSKARSAMDERKAVVILDEAPRILKEKQIRESDATRQAICDLDATYQQARDVYEKLYALQEMLKHQMKSLEMAYTSAKKILGENPKIADRSALLGGLPPGNYESGSVFDG